MAVDKEALFDMRTFGLTYAEIAKHYKIHKGYAWHLNSKVKWRREQARAKELGKALGIPSLRILNWWRGYGWPKDQPNPFNP